MFYINVLSLKVISISFENWMGAMVPRTGVEPVHPLYGSGGF